MIIESISSLELFLGTFLSKDSGGGSKLDRVQFLDYFRVPVRIQSREPIIAPSVTQPQPHN